MFQGKLTVIMADRNHSSLNLYIHFNTIFILIFTDPQGLIDRSQHSETEKL